MSTFTPPVTLGRPLALNPQHPAYQLFKHYAPHAAGINLWIVGGVVTTQQPAVLGPTDREFLGSHIYTVTDAEAALLTAAGYGPYITG